jgi:hypothetical protein
MRTTPSDPSQLSFRRTDFAPVWNGAGHYVAAVQNKTGELAALSHATSDTWERMTPLISIVGPKGPPDAYKIETVARWVKRVADAVGLRPFFLDTLRLSPGHPTQTRDGDGQVLGMIHDEARRRGMEFVPILPLGGAHSPEHVAVVRDTAGRDGRGAALRYPIRRIAPPPGMTHASILTDALKDIDVNVESADVLVDLSYLAAEDELHPDYVSEAIEDVLAAGDWRSVVLLGTSMPSMLGEVPEGTVGSLPRREWELWSEIRRSLPQRIPSYGDYVIQHPDPPRDDEGGGPSMRANIRYTVTGQTLIARGRGPVIQVGREQYRVLCQQLVERSEFAGSEFSWGDCQIAACAQGEIEPGWQPLWRGAGSSHHFRVVTDQLRG